MKQLQALKAMLQTLQVDALWIASPSNRRYVSGFTGSNGMIYLSEKTQALITDFRYLEQAAKQCEGFQIIDQGSQGLIKTAMAQAKAEGIKRIGFESDHTNYSTFLAYQEEKDLCFVPTTQVVETMRQIKTPEELKKIEQAEAIGDLAFSQIIPLIQANYNKGLTEQDVALELERIMRKNGAEGTSFDSIVACGSKSSLCHAVPDQTTLDREGFLVMDFGCKFEGYCSDMTRTIMIGEPSEKHLKIYETVRLAQEEALRAIRPGMQGKEVDAVARKVIEEAGYGAYFGHGLGHSLGLDIHENPRFSTLEKQIIEKNMVITVEPGIYIPDFGGVRIEDLIVVTDDGYRNLTQSTKDLIIIR